MSDSTLNPEYERAITQGEASKRLGMTIERGDRAGRHYAIHTPRGTVLIISRAHIEFAEPVGE